MVVMREIYNIYDICDHGSPYRVKTNLIMLNIDREFSDFFVLLGIPLSPSYMKKN